jgi:hypothetical protein
MCYISIQQSAGPRRTRIRVRIRIRKKNRQSQLRNNLTTPRMHPRKTTPKDETLKTKYDGPPDRAPFVYSHILLAITKNCGVGRLCRGHVPTALPAEMKPPRRKVAKGPKDNEEHDRIGKEKGQWHDRGCELRRAVQLTAVSQQL